MLCTWTTSPISIGIVAEPIGVRNLIIFSSGIIALLATLNLSFTSIFISISSFSITINRLNSVC